MAMAAYKGKMVVCGGKKLLLSSSECFTYSAETNAWEAFAALPGDR